MENSTITVEPGHFRSLTKILPARTKFKVLWTRQSAGRGSPTSGSWLNAVERVFSDVKVKCLRRRSVDNVEALQKAISEHLDRRNETPKPFHWKAPVVEILRKVKRAWGVLHDRYGAKKPSAALNSIERYLDAVDARAG
jgi:hypothetical protein